MVLYEKRSKNLGRAVRWGLATEVIVVIAAVMGLCGTVGAISFGNILGHIKDVDLDTYKTGADLKIAQANLAAAAANQKAREARDEAEHTEKANIQLQKEVIANKVAAEQAEVLLAKQNKKTFDYAHAVAQQQATMAEQAHVSPVLSREQIVALSATLSRFAGQDVIMRSTPDTTVLRFKQSVEQALSGAGVTTKENSIIFTALFQGISVVVHSPQDVPPIANALVGGLKAAGVSVHTASANAVPPGRVALYMGPN